MSACPGHQQQGPRPLRADAERNRAAIVTAAREVFARQGLTAPLEEIAAQAGVGIATLYRRFPTRERLVGAALADKVCEYAGAAEAALACDDPRAGFTGFVRAICELQSGDRGLADLLSMGLPADEEVEALRAQAGRAVAALIDRAKAAGVLRADFVAQDLLLLQIANAGVVHVTGLDAPLAWRRFTALALDAFLAAGAPPLPPPPTAAQMNLAMRRLATERGCGEGA